jgi:hypothetical protein
VISNLDDRLKAFFERAEGPAEAFPLPRRRRSKVSFALAAAVVAVVAAAAVVAVVDRHGGSKPSVSRSGVSCAALLRWRGHVYVGNRVAAAPERGAPVEDGTTPRCEDVPAAPAHVTRLVGIDPRTAIGSADDPTIVWIVAGRCAGFSQRDVLSCLREDLTFDGRRYVPTRLEQPLEQGQPVGTGRLLDKSVEVRSLTGVPKEVAVATDAEPGLVFVADGRCELSELVRLPSCLRGS